VSRLLARVDGESGWRDVPLPRGCRGLIVLNLQSYAGGRNLWGPKSLCRDTPLCCASKQDVANAVAPPAYDDGVLEVVTADDVFSMGATLVKTNGLGGRAKRLVRAKELRLTTREPLYMQIDGEPWLQPAATVHLKCLGQSTVLTRAK
jgi:diacylglycerol kinase (ATP)